jgi:hypothetical protein
MAGLHMSDVERAAQIRALLDELGQYERRAAGEANEETKASWTARADEVREQLRLRGHEGSPPRQRAAKRLRPTQGIEAR